MKYNLVKGEFVAEQKCHIRQRQIHFLFNVHCMLKYRMLTAANLLNAAAPNLFQSPLSKTKKLIGDAGITFTNAVSTIYTSTHHPQCV